MPIYRKCSHCSKKVLQGALCQCEIEANKARHKNYNKKVRFSEQNKIYSDFYNSTAWQKQSKHIRTKYCEACLKCLIEYKILLLSDVVHHIETIREAFGKRLEEENLIPLCHGCHNAIDHDNYSDDTKAYLKTLLKKYDENYI